MKYRQVAPMKRISALALALLICLTVLPALAALRTPENRGAVTDDADVLSAQTVKDVKAYAEQVKDETGLGLYVAVVHFLDGAEVKAYAAQLFSQWALGDDDVLLLGAAGEDSFATVMGKNVGKKLGEKNAENLMYLSSDFGEAFKHQQYDKAMDSWFTALNALINKQCGADIDLGDKFKSAQSPTETPAPGGDDYASQIWRQVLYSIDEHSTDYQTYQENRQDDDNGIGVGGWIILIVLVMIIFSQSDPVRKSRNARRGNYRHYGCGCSPLGWILTMIGAGALIDRLRNRR